MFGPILHEAKQIFWMVHLKKFIHVGQCTVWSDKNWCEIQTLEHRHNKFVNYLIDVTTAYKVRVRSFFLKFRCCCVIKIWGGGEYALSPKGSYPRINALAPVTSSVFDIIKEIIAVCIWEQKTRKYTYHQVPPLPS